MKIGSDVWLMKESKKLGLKVVKVPLKCSDGLVRCFVESMPCYGAVCPQSDVCVWWFNGGCCHVGDPNEK